MLIVRLLVFGSRRIQPMTFPSFLSQPIKLISPRGALVVVYSVVPVFDSYGKIACDSAVLLMLSLCVL